MDAQMSAPSDLPEDAPIDKDTKAPIQDTKDDTIPDKPSSPQPAAAPEQQDEPPPVLDPNSDDPMKMPPHGTEVYVGGITKSATDEQIREFCEQKGEVFRLRCPHDPTIPGQNRGYAFVTYTTRQSAQNAVESLNQTEMKDFPEKKVCLLLSQVKNRLFVGNIPKGITKEELKEIFNKEVEGIVDVELLMDYDRVYNRGFCFLECYNHSAADVIRKKLSRSDFTIKDRGVTVTWAEPRKAESEQEKVKSIYVGNLPATATESKLKDIFEAYGDIEKVVMLPSRQGRSQRDYGFVHYVDRSCALKAVEASETTPLFLDDKRLHVSVARPTHQRDDEGSSSRRAQGSRLRDDYREPYGYPHEGYGAPGGGYPPGPYGGMALVPTYLPNGQVGFVFQQTMQGGGHVPMGRSTQPHHGSHRYRPY